MSLSVTETTVNNCVLGIVQPFCDPFTTSSVYGSIRNTDRQEIAIVKSTKDNFLQLPLILLGLFLVFHRLLRP